MRKSTLLTSLLLLSGSIPTLAAPTASSAGTKTSPVKVTTAKAVPAKVAPATDSREVFSYQDYLDHDWINELIRVPLTPAQAQLLAAKPALLGPDGQPVPYQLADKPDQATGGTTGAPAPVIQFLANIKSGERASYHFSTVPDSAGKTPETDLRFEEDDATIRLTNHLIGISLRKKLGAGEGPIETVKLTSGAWIGGSKLGDKLAVTAYSAKVIARGPVFNEVECRTEFAGGASWTLNFRLHANEPVIVVRESMELGDAQTTFSLGLGENFDPDQMFFRGGIRNSVSDIGTNLQTEIKPGNCFVLEPWLRWYVRPEQGPVFSVFREDTTDMLSVGAGFASLWVDPKITAEKRAAPLANLMKDDAGLHLDFLVKNGRRQWMIMTPGKGESLRALDDPKKLTGPSLPHQLVIKHGQFPLNLVKDYVLYWPSTTDKHPALLMTKARVASYRSARAKDAPLTDQQIAAATSVKPINQFNMEAPLTAYYATGNEAVAQFLIKESKAATRDLVDTFLQQPTVPYGSAPHHLQPLGSTPLILDAILDDPAVSQELRKKLLAQIAFCSYAINRDDFWSEERGYSANPNMTTSVIGYRIGMACLMPSHPMAKEWVTKGLGGLKTLLYGWSDDNGGWLEAPHYAMTSYDVLLGCTLMARNAGLSDMLFDPKMKSVINWFSKWSTPKDSRIGGFRHLPPVGNTYMYEPTGEFGLVAAAFKDKDPEFASQMQWMFRQQKSVDFPGVGGGAPTFAGHRRLLIDGTIPEKAPPWGSELFPRTGVVLRNTYPSDRETYMLLLQGNFDGWRSHWDDDSGSVTIWGKGRIISDDFGYYVPSSADHSLPMAPEIAAGRTYNVQTFAPSRDFDYVSGTRGAWQRQVALVKNQDPLEPNYFVMADTFKTAAPAAWRMCFTASKVTPGAQSVQVEGKEDVDTDIFFAAPATIPMKTEEKTRTSNSGFYADGRQGAVTTTQIALIASAPTDGNMTYVLYPRLKTEKPPMCTPIADGKGFKIVTATGTDYVFLSAAPVTWKDDSVTFTGKSGSVRLRDEKVTLSLGEGGTITAFGETLTAKQAARKEFVR